MNKRTDLRNVYVVDDNRDVRRSLSYMLSASDTPSRPFGSGQDFLDAILQDVPAQQIQMPVQLGVERGVFRAHVFAHGVFFVPVKQHEEITLGDNQ